MLVLKLYKLRLTLATVQKHRIVATHVSEWPSRAVVCPVSQTWKGGGVIKDNSLRELSKKVPNLRQRLNRGVGGSAPV